MKERPILFQGAMVRAILAGTKTQTRRAVKPQPPEECGIHYMLGNESWLPAEKRGPLHHCWEAWGGPLYQNRPKKHLCGSHSVKCPYGAPGDRLWVRETWMDLQGTGIEARTPTTGKLTRYAYGADTLPGSYGDQCRKDLDLKWKPSIHMPRAVCRIVLEVTGVRVERLQAISEADALAEGIAYSERFSGYCIGEAQHYHSADPRESYFSLWEAINGPGSVQANPWVWVVEFRGIQP
ncbi:MAG: phage-related protein [Variovorax sp.]|nr:phage-related protein [Variovorax sp.]